MIPSGAVTFVFSDIEGSTVRWEADRDAMEAALRRHDALLARTFHEHGGYVFKTIGDAFCTAFSDALPALEAALAIQRRLASEDWTAVDGLRVRMAIHSGTTDERDGDYFGPVVNRVARLLATAHGGQIVVSQAVALAAGDALPPGARLRDLGLHVLKDLREPENVFQLVAPGVASDFRPLRSAAARSDNLPSPVSRFIGREDELRELGALVQTDRLVTVLGPGGVGKTRLALRAGERFVNAGGEACFVNLAPLRDGALIAGSILAALGAPENARDPLETLIGRLRGRRILLVLDNCEHLIGDVASVVQAIGQRSADAVVLCTSREPLNIHGEKTLRIAPFDLATAVDVFCDRATAVNPRFALTSANRETIEAICRAVDGIALALELAAARLRAISLEDLAKRLNERFRILAGGTRSELPHHQTMHALIDWSYELLAPGEQRLFRRLAVFPGRFTLEAAAAVCADDEIDELAVLDLLTALVDKSLVVAQLDGIPDYRQLQLIREFARERLAGDDDRMALSARHAHWFAAVAESAYLAWDVAPPADWLATIAPDIDNLRVALEWALAQGRDPAIGVRLAAAALPIFLRLALLDEGTFWFEAAAARAAESDDATRARLEYGASMLFNNRVAFKRALESARAALAAYESCGDARGIVRACSQLAQQCARAGLRPEARTHAERAVALAWELHDERLLAGTLQRGAMVFEPSEIERARDWFGQSVALFRRLGRDEETARALQFWSVAEADAACLERALDIALEGLRLSGPDTRPFLANSIAAFAIALGRDDVASVMAREAFATAADKRHPVLLPLAFTYLAAVHAADDPDAAARIFGYAQARLRAQEWTFDEVDEAVESRTRGALRTRLSDAAIDALATEGAAWDEARAILRGHQV